MRLHSSLPLPISFSATNTSWLEKNEERGSDNAMATSRTRIGAFVGGLGHWSCPWACRPAPARQLAASKSRAVIQFFILKPIYALLAWACHISAEAHQQTRESFQRARLF